MVLRNFRVVQASVISALLLVSAISIIQWSTAQLKGTFTADLTPRPGSNATGKATLELQDNGRSVKYTVSGSGYNNVTAIAISQIAGSGRTPDVVSIRQPSQSGIGPTSGSLSGNFTASDLMGPLNGKGMADFVKAILDGKLIFRVSTTAFPLGEIVGNVTAGGGAGGNMTAGGNMSAG